jgi:hypothetical protein
VQPDFVRWCLDQICTDHVGLGNNAYDPNGSFVLDDSGNIYETTQSGGDGNAGTVWEITP